MMPPPIHVVIHRRPTEFSEKPAVELLTQRISPLDIDRPLPLAVTFDDVLARLVVLDRIFLEADGSFVWSGDGWQIDGQINDGGDTVDHVELKGTCGIEKWRTILQILGGGTSELMIQFVREGIYVRAEHFGRLCV